MSIGIRKTTINLWLRTEVRSHTLQLAMHATTNIKHTKGSQKYKYKKYLIIQKKFS